MFLFKCYKLISFQRFYGTLLIAEHSNEKIAPVTKNALTACKEIGKDISILVAGKKCRSVSHKLSKANGVKAILEADDEAFKYFQVENITELVLDLHKRKQFTHIVCGSSSFGRSLLPRIAGKLDVSPVTDVIKIASEETFSRTIYSGSAIMTLMTKENPKVLTVRSTCFDKDPCYGGSVQIEGVSKSDYEYNSVKVVSRDLIEYDRPQLDVAKIVVSGGKGFQSREKFKLIYDLADTLTAAVGCTRAVVDAGFAPSDLQIGQSGKVVAPRLYIAIGLSGAVQHVVGMRDSKTIVAINKDKDASIFKLADYGIVGDLFKIVPELICKLK